MIDVGVLARDGFVTVPLAQLPEIESCCAALFRSSEVFFRSAERVQWRGRSTEEGYSVVPGEKQLFTVKTRHVPCVILEDAARCWRESAALLKQIAHQCAQHCSLPTSAFDSLINPCLELDKHTPSLLRLFQYERPQQDFRVVAEPHRDLGLLTLVVGGSPGLEATRDDGKHWLDLESDGLTATILVGQTMRFLTQDRFKAGMHRVKCHAMAGETTRQSIVFALRPAPAMLDLDVFGDFPQHYHDAYHDKPATTLLGSIAKSHVNINAGYEVRSAQRTTSRVYAPPPGPPPQIDLDRS